MTDVLLFAAYPYVAAVLLVVISILRYRENAYTVSSLSSQFLESGKLFWGSVPFHLGILTVFLGHLVGFLFPRTVMAFASHPVRLLVIELSGLVAALLFLVGIVLLILRRLSVARLRPVTTTLDFVVYGLLLFQVATGLYISLFLRWGSAWYVNVAVPYLRSLCTFQPEVELLTGVPWVARLHILGAFTLIAIFSFTRLVHVLVAPLPYLWRRPQLVVWNRDRKSVRKVEQSA
jgi:nitrate reductase gamma subunit